MVVNKQAREADRLFRQNKHQRALVHYRSLVDAGGGESDERGLWRLRTSLCLFHSEQRQEALQVAQSLARDFPGTIWEARALHWLALLDGSGLTPRSRARLEAAEALYTAFGGKYGSRMEEIRLRLDLLLNLDRDARGRQHPGPDPFNADLWRVVPGEPYSPEWPVAKKIHCLFQQVHALADLRPDLADVAINAGIAEAFWLDRQRRGNRPHLRACEPSAHGLPPAPYTDHPPFGRLQELLTAFETHPRHPEMLLTLGALAIASGDLVQAEAALQNYRPAPGQTAERLRVRHLLDDIRARMLWVHGSLRQPAGGPARLRLMTRNVEEVELRLYWLDLRGAWESYAREAARPRTWEEVNVMLQNPAFGGLLGAGPLFRSFLVPLGDPWRKRIPGVGDHRVHHREIEIPLPGPEVYVVEARAGEERATVLFIASDLSVVSRTAAGHVCFHVTDSRTGKPVSGARLDVQVSNQVREPHVPVREVRLTTDAHGRAELPERIEGRTYAAICEANGQLTLLLPHRTEPKPEPEPARAFCILDRAAYRPGETVHFRWIVVRNENGAWRPVPRVHLYVGLSARCRTSLVSSGGITNEFGTVAGSLKLPAWSPPDTYWLDVSSEIRGFRSDGKLNLVPVEGEPVAVRITPFGMPEPQLVLEPRTTVFRVGTPVSVRVRAYQPTGEPLAGRVLRYRLRVGGYLRIVTRDFMRTEVEVRDWFRKSISGTLELDADGHGEILIPADIEIHRDRDWEHALRPVQVEVMLDEPNDYEVVAYCTLTAFVRPPAPCVRLASSFIGPQESAVILVSRAHEPIPIVPGRIKIRRASEEPPASESLSVIPVTAGEGDGEKEIRLEWLPPGPGRYRLAYVPDDEAAAERSPEIPFWVFGTHGQLDVPSGGLGLVPHDQEPREDGLFRALLLTPAPGCHVLVRLESSAELLLETWVKVPGRAHELALPLTPGDTSAAWVYVRTIVDGQLFEARTEVRAPPNAAVVHVSLLQTIEDPVTDAPAGGPPSTRIRVETRDGHGRPVDAEVSLSVRSNAVDAVLPLDPELTAPLFPEERSRFVSHSNLGRSLLDGNALYRIRRESRRGGNLYEFRWVMPRPPDPLGFGLFVEDPSPEHSGWRLDLETMMSEDQLSEDRLPPEFRSGWDPSSESAERKAPRLFAASEATQLLSVPDARPVRVPPDHAGTACWEPALVTGPEGVAEVEFPRPDPDFTWRVRAVAVTRDGRVGQAELELSLPTSPGTLQGAPSL